MIDFDEMIKTLEEIRLATGNINEDCDGVMELFELVTKLFHRWGVGTDAEHRNEQGRLLAFRRFGKDYLFQFVVCQPEHPEYIRVASLKRHDKLDIIHQLPPLLHNIHTKLVEQKAASTPIGDIVARLERLWDIDENHQANEESRGSS